MNKTALQKNLPVIITTLLVTVFLYSATQLIGTNRTALQKTDESQAQTACDTSFITITNPTGLTFSKKCLLGNAQMYNGDTRFFFFEPQTNLTNVPYIYTQNTEIKDNTALSWSLKVSKAATVYIMPRFIPGLTQPTWITSGFTRSTNDNLAQTSQYFKRKNGVGLIGVYDIFYKSLASGASVTLKGASDATHPAYSMYVVAVVPGSAPTPSTTPTASSQAPANLLAIAQQHVKTTQPIDCWAVYNYPNDGWHLYNLSDYFSVTIGTKVIKQHPGGDDDLIWACGKDITDVFNKGASTMGVSGHGDKNHLNKSSAMSKLKSLQVPNQ